MSVHTWVMENFMLECLNVCLHLTKGESYIWIFEYSSSLVIFSVFSCGLLCLLLLSLLSPKLFLQHHASVDTDCLPQIMPGSCQGCERMIMPGLWEDDHAINDYNMEEGLEPVCVISIVFYADHTCDQLIRAEKHDNSPGCRSLQPAFAWMHCLVTANMHYSFHQRAVNPSRGRKGGVIKSELVRWKKKLLRHDQYQSSTNLSWPKT